MGPTVGCSAPDQGASPFYLNFGPRRFFLWRRSVRRVEKDADVLVARVRHGEVGHAVSVEIADLLSRSAGCPRENSPPDFKVPSPFPRNTSTDPLLFVASMSMCPSPSTSPAATA